MSRYISECDRQIRVYGTYSPPPPPSSPPSRRTPPSTPAPSDSTSSPLTPRGIAAVPLISAAASESQLHYMDRMAVTIHTNGWWSRQEPLCLGPEDNSILLLPERAVIIIASAVERMVLTLPKNSIVPANVVQAAIWPLHNLLLALWSAYVLIFHLFRTTFDVGRTVALGSRRTGISISRSVGHGLVPAAEMARTLTAPRHSLSVRAVGVTMIPLVFVGDGASWMLQEGGSVITGILLVMTVVTTWWYWTVVLPSVALMGFWAAIFCGGCFALIEFAGI
mmetsp:Transcript_30435/g.69678  ORF Transcript_30435/g.69678 Transcript_30435/m.69678 type:complete len:279 (-) Transcript_30435:110-946(-)